MKEFVESVLRRTNPGGEFAQKIQASLFPPIGVEPGTAGIAGKGGAAAKSGAVSALLSWLGPFVGLVAGAGMSLNEIPGAATKRERRFAILRAVALGLLVLASVVVLPRAASLAPAAGPATRQDWSATAPAVAVWFGFSTITVTLIVRQGRGKVALHREMNAEGIVRSVSPALVPMRKRVAPAAGFQASIFWVPIFLAWQTGDRAVAFRIVCGVLLGVAPFLIGPKFFKRADEAKEENWNVASCGLAFLAILNWFPDVWLAPVHGVDAETMSRLLPMEIIRWPSFIAVASGIDHANRRECVSRALMAETRSCDFLCLRKIVQLPRPKMRNRLCRSGSAVVETFVPGECVEDASKFLTDALVSCDAARPRILFSTEKPP